MSTGAAKKSELNGEAARDILKEYTAKLRDVYAKAHKAVEQRKRQKQMQKVDDRVDEDELVKFWKMFKPPVKRLGQFVSQMVEHSQMDPLTEIELSVRLSEYEYYFLATDAL